MEEEKEVETEKVESEKGSGNGVLIVVIVMLLLVIGALCIFILVNKEKIFDSKADKPEITEKDTKTKEKDESAEYKFAYDSSKVKNNEDSIFGPVSASGMTGVGYGVNEENKKEVNVTINWNLVKTGFGDTLQKEKDSSYTGKITFDKEVSDIFCGGVGLDVTGYKVLFLMADGTVQYIDEYNAVMNENFTDVKKISDLKNVVKFYSVSSSPKDSRETGGHYTILMQTDDGNLYDLEKMIG